MTNEIKVFSNEEFGKVRVLSIDGETWFAGKDVANALGYERDTKAVVDHVDEDDRKNIDGKTQSCFGIELGQRGGWIINESGVYSLILSSKLPSAKKFKRWVTSEVLPAIRKTGSYNLPDFNNPAEAARAWAKEYEEKQKALAQVTEMKPKAEFYDDVTGSTDTIDIGSVAKVLNIPNMGRNKLFAFLRENKILNRRNEPYQEYVDKGYFRQIETSWEHNGTTHINLKTVVFQKGLDFIRQTIAKKGR